MLLSRLSRQETAVASCGALLLALAASGAVTAAPLHAQTSFAPPAHGSSLIYKGHHFTIGSAAAKALAIQNRPPGPNIVVWPANGALFVADPALNGVMVYDESQTGPNILPYGILAGPNTLLNGPVAVTIGPDLPCNTGACQSYLWVSNAGNNTISQYTLPLTSWNQAPVVPPVSWNGTGACGNGNSNPYGIVHTGPFGTSMPGENIVTSETNVAGSYYMVGFFGNATGPNPCSTSYSSPQFLSPSGPSIYNAATNLIFNANSNTVTESQLITYNPGPPTLSWVLSASPATEGTAVQQGGSAATSYVWVTTSKNSTFTQDAIWRCRISTFPACPPNKPVCVNPGANLDFPDFPAISNVYNRIYVPNQNNGTATSYKLVANCVQKATYVNLQTPLGTGVQN